MALGFDSCMAPISDKGRDVPTLKTLPTGVMNERKCYGNYFSKLIQDSVFEFYALGRNYNSRLQIVEIK